MSQLTEHMRNIESSMKSIGIGAAGPLPAPSLETELSELHAALSNLEAEANSFASGLRFVSFEAVESATSNSQTAPNLPAALSLVRAARERVYSLSVLLSDARTRIAL